MQSLILACGETMLDWLQDQALKFKDHPELFKAWYDKQGVENRADHKAFWQQILIRQKQEVQLLKIDSTIAAITSLVNVDKSQQKHAVAIVSSLRSANLNVRPPSVSQHVWDLCLVGQAAFSTWLKKAFSKSITELTEKKHQLLWRPGKLFAEKTNFGKLKDTLLDQWRRSSNSEFKWPTWFIAVDESRSLLERVHHAEKERIFHVYRNAGRFLPPYYERSVGEPPTDGGLVLLVTDTCSRISNFAGPVQASSRDTSEDKELLNPFLGFAINRCV